MRRWYLLLLLPFAGLLYPPLYTTDTPELFGFPFFYWYQFAWVPVASILTWIVYRKTSRPERAPADQSGSRFVRERGGDTT
jgi:hypothetical protein